MASDDGSQQDLPEETYTEPVVGYIVLKSNYRNNNDMVTAVPIVQGSDMVEFGSGGEVYEVEDDREVIGVIPATGIVRDTMFGEGAESVTETTYRPSE